MPVFHFSMGCFRGGCQALSPVTDGTPVFFWGMVLEQRRWVGREGLFCPLPARIIDPEMTGDAAVSAMQRFDIELFDSDLLSGYGTPRLHESGCFFRVCDVLNGFLQPLQTHCVKRFL